MNEIVIDLSKFSEEVQEALKERAVREAKPMKLLMAEIIAANAQAILTASAGETKEAV